MKPVLAIIFTLLGSWPALASTAGAGPASPALQACAREVNAKHAPAPRDLVLSKGVNMTTIFDAGSAEHDLSDIRRLRAVGIRHVRIPIDPGWVLTWKDAGAPDEKLHRLDDAVCTAVRSGLGVIVDNHDGDLQPRDDSTDATLHQLAAAWDRLASRYAIFTPDLVFFEALNEPAFTDGKRWEPWQRELLAHIRAAAPKHTVLLTASSTSTAWALAGLTPVKDDNVVYVFHFYTPMIFTAQGAEWNDPTYETVRGLEYPANAANVALVAVRAKPSYHQELQDYLKRFADAHTLETEIDLAARWARKNHVQLICDEFGVYDAVAPPASRAAWLHDVRAALEARSIGWTVWELRGGFGIESDLYAPCRTAPTFRATSVRAALGLCSPVQSAGRDGPDRSIRAGGEQAD